MRALIIDVTGQVGQYLAELLHKKNHEVFGLSMARKLGMRDR